MAARKVCRGAGGECRGERRDAGGGNGPGRGWVRETTLGSKKAAFWWRADERGGIELHRSVKRGQLRPKLRQVVPAEDVEALVGWLARRKRWAALGSHPNAVRKGKATGSLGWFLMKRRKWAVSAVHFAAHLATVLVKARVLSWNGQTKGMGFLVASEDVGLVHALFLRQQGEQGDEPPPADEEPPAERIRRPSWRGSRKPNQQPPMWDLGEQMRAQGRALRARFDECESGLHALQKGERREAAVREFLARVLPEGFRVGRGEIVAATGEASRQIDALVYSTAARPLQETDASVVVAAELACAAIEVKPALDGHHLPEAMANVASAKGLERRALLRVPGGPAVEENPPLFGAIFAFSAPEPRRVLDLMAEAESDAGSHRGVDAVCLLDRALIFRYPGLLGPPGEEDRPPGRLPLCCTEAGEDSLALFFLLLYYHLVLKRRLPPDPMHYGWTLSMPEPAMR